MNKPTLLFILALLIVLALAMVSVLVTGEYIPRNSNYTIDEGDWSFYEIAPPIGKFTVGGEWVIMGMGTQLIITDSVGLTITMTGPITVTAKEK